MASINDGGNVGPLQLGELTSAWHGLREKYPGQFASTPSEAVAWHLREAQQSEAEGNITAASFHLERALERAPLDPVIARRRAELTAAAGPKTKPDRPGPLPPGHIPARDPEASPGQIDLSRHYNLGLRDSLSQNQNGNDFSQLPCGLQRFGGVRFDVRGLVHLSGQGVTRAGQIYPDRADDIRVGQKCRRLHFLQATSWDASVGSQTGTYVLHYADGQQLEMPIVYGRDLVNWWFWGFPTELKDSSSAFAVWIGNNRSAAKTDKSICLYKSTRENPWPDVEVVSIDFISNQSEAAPFLVALTVE